MIPRRGAVMIAALLLLAIAGACGRKASNPEPGVPGSRDAGPAAGAPGVRVGLDRLAAGEGGPLAGLRVGLLAHAASVTADGRHAIEVLRERGADLLRLFGPEHGLRGEAAAGERVASGIDPASGLPVVSLHGDRHRPAPEELADLDLLVIDLQDAGVRFYTYSSTLLLVLEEAARQDLQVLVLDRPNPLGGMSIAGPESAPRSVVPASLLNRAPGPLIHGLTLGEMARLAWAEMGREHGLTVLPMEGWRRSMTWGDTGRPWVAPSPNLRSADAALVYPGVALLEATAVSEGRGTTAPFLRFGAPWLDRGSLTLAPAGLALHPLRFTPRPSPAAPAPQFAGEICQGFAIEVIDPGAVDPYTFGVELLAALRRQPGFAWRDDGAALTRLVGTPALHAALERGDSVATIVAADTTAHERWRQRRRPALLYPEETGPSAGTRGQR